jgi:hypothetical protein
MKIGSFQFMLHQEAKAKIHACLTGPKDSLGAGRHCVYHPSRED